MNAHRDLGWDTQLKEALRPLALRNSSEIDMLSGAYGRKTAGIR